MELNVRRDKFQWHDLTPETGWEENGNFTLFRLDTTVSQGHTRSLRHNKPQDCSCLKGGRGQPQHSINLETQVPFLSFPPLGCCWCWYWATWPWLERSICGWTYMWTYLSKGRHSRRPYNDLKVWTYTERVTREKFQILPLRLSACSWSLNS